MQPPVALTNVVCAGSVSVTAPAAEACVPWFWIWIVYVSRSPGAASRVIDHLREAQVGVRGGERGNGQKAAHGNQQHEHAAHRAPGNQVHRRLLVSLVQFPRQRDLAEPSNPSIEGRRGNRRTSGGS